MTKLTPEVKDALEGTLAIARLRLADARTKRVDYGTLFEQAQDEEYAAEQTVLALEATLDEPEPPVEDKYKTFGED
jgi:hypothetical protein